MPNETTNQLDQTIAKMQSIIRMQGMQIESMFNMIADLREENKNLNRYTDELNEEQVKLNRRTDELSKAGNERFKYLDDAITQNAEAIVDLDDRMDVCERDSENARERADENQTDISHLEECIEDLSEQLECENLEELTEFISGEFNRMCSWMRKVDARLGGE